MLQLKSIKAKNMIIKANELKPLLVSKPKNTQSLQYSILNNIKPLLISPPFSNYLSYKLANNIYGTYTLSARHGALIKFLRTVRYLPKHKSWLNSIGLKNAGILKAKNPKLGNIISIHGFNNHDWELLFQALLKLQANNFTWSAVELNLSCPNVLTTEIKVETLKKFLQYFPIIAKMSPKISARRQMLILYEAGVRCFHCCNTLKINQGGISGQALLPYSLKQIKWINKTITDAKLIIIAGGGINSLATAEQYLDLGVKKLSLSTVNFNPLLTSRLLKQLAEKFKS